MMDHSFQQMMVFLQQLRFIGATEKEIARILEGDTKVIAHVLNRYARKEIRRVIEEHLDQYLPENDGE